MKKSVLALCGIILTLSLAGCGGSADEVIQMSGVWEDDMGNLIEFLPEESSYILETAEGRIGRGEYKPESGLMFFNRFNYTFEALEDGSVMLYRNGSPADDSEESMDGFVFSPSSENSIDEYDISMLDGTWINEDGTTVTIDSGSMEYKLNSETTVGTGTISDEHDGRGLYLFSDGYVYFIYDGGSLYFDTDEDDFSGMFTLE
jgi:hypothetical protein